MELRPKGKRHSILRDKRAVTHHYNLSNEFFALFLDESMTYSCAIWSRGATTLEEAQRTKLDLVCTKLGAAAGRARARRRLRLGRVRAARGARVRRARHRDHALSEPQAALARAARGRGRAWPTGSTSASWTTARSRARRSTRSPRSGWSSTSGSVNIDAVRGQARLAAAAGRAAAQPRDRAAARRRRRGRPVLGALRLPGRRAAAPLADPVALERAGLHTRHVEDFPDDYARTLLEWQRRFEANIDRARELGGDERVRVWRIYLRVSRQGFESGFMSVYQVRAVKPSS